jgi:carbamoyltransferase
VQILAKDANPRFEALLREFWKITGLPVLLNTSFNVSGEAIVETPDDAIASSARMNLDAIALGEFVLVRATGVREH